MKLLFTILFLSLLSCDKANDLTNPTQTGDPKINDVKFYRVAAGLNESVRFDVTLTSDSTVVNSVALYLTPNKKVWEVKKPQTGKYTMYDHLGDYPTYAQNYMYYFVFFKKDGSKVITEPFQVY